MPIALKKDVWKVKDPSSGQYRGAAILSTTLPQDAAQIISESNTTIQNIKDTAIDAVDTALNDESTGLIPKAEADRDAIDDSLNNATNGIIPTAQSDRDDIDDSLNNINDGIIPTAQANLATIAAAVQSQIGQGTDKTLSVAKGFADAKAAGMLVKVSDYQPGSALDDPATSSDASQNTGYPVYKDSNRVWVKETYAELEVPTMDDVDDLKSALNDISDELFQKENILNTSIHLSTNPAVTFNNDGTATIGTSSYGHTFWDSPKQLTKGTYELFGVPAGLSFISTSNNKNNAIVTNETNNGLTFDLQTTGTYYIGYYIGARPSESFNISPYLKTVEQKLEYLDDIKEDIKPASLSTIFNFERGNIATATGGDYNGDETYKSKNYRSKNFLDLSDYESTIKIAQKQSNSNLFTLRVACYSGSDVSTYLGYHDFTSTADISPEIVNGTKYVRLGIAGSSAFTYSDDLFNVSYGVITHLNALVGKMQTLEGYNAPTGLQKVFCVMGYNAGEYGEVSAENYNSVLLTHQSMIARFDPDVMCVAEFSNTFGAENTETVLLSEYFKHIINNLPQTQYAGKAICCNVPMVVGNGTTIQFATNPSRNTYKTYAMLNGKLVCLISTHSDYDTTAHIEGEMIELLSILQDEEYFILYGDFNCMTNEARELTYGALEDAGYNLASSKTRGLVPTYGNFAIDNIVTSSNISIITVYADRQKYDNTDITNKDHNPIIAYVAVE